jgi:hypothetical protein
MTEIIAQNLLAKGYREFPGSAECEVRFFQKCFLDDAGKKYFVEFREWHIPGTPNAEQKRVTFDTRICCDTDTGGYLWACFREETIEAAEARAIAMWEAAGSVYYERDNL